MLRLQNFIDKRHASVPDRLPCKHAPQIVRRDVELLPVAIHGALLHRDVLIQLDWSQRPPHRCREALPPISFQEREQLPRREILDGNVRARKKHTLAPQYRAADSEMCSSILCNGPMVLRMLLQELCVGQHLKPCGPISLRVLRQDQGTTGTKICYRVDQCSDDLVRIKVVQDLAQRRTEFLFSVAVCFVRFNTR